MHMDKWLHEFMEDEKRSSSGRIDKLRGIIGCFGMLPFARERMISKDMHLLKNHFYYVYCDNYSIFIRLNISMMNKLTIGGNCDMCQQVWLFKFQYAS